LEILKIILSILTIGILIYSRAFKLRQFYMEIFNGVDKNSKIVLKTLNYFDIFDFPLTLPELFKWLKSDSRQDKINIGSLSQLETIISALGGSVVFKNGFYFLPGREKILANRQDGYNFSEVKFKRARKYVRLLSLIPFIQCVMICNRLGYGNVHRDSDIDLAVIVQHKCLWLSRFLAVGLLDLLRVRPKQTARRLAIDLNFFISADSLNVESLMRDEDFVFPYWLSQIIPVYDRGAYNNFVEQNGWLKEFLPNYYPYGLIERRRVKDSAISRSIRFIMKLVFNYDFWERWTEKFQRKIMPQDLRKMINKDSRVIINQNILKFHQSENWIQLREILGKRYEQFN
jgi:hypothetical protein